MNFNISDFFSTIALVLIIEGVFPFAAPEYWRLFFRQMIELPDLHIRAFGLFLMLFGVLIIFFVH